ncbi:MAG: exported protein of unknown function [Nitrospira sp.]|jgi:hypothetical protein|nr:exported protein of unknown function [Nitrospira sp.]
MRAIRRDVGFIALAAILLSSAPSSVFAAGGTAKGEHTDETGQQGVGLGHAGESSNVIKGGPDIIVGKISGIQGEQYSIEGDRGQQISLRVTKDTNLVCSEGQGTKFKTGQQSGKEHEEIPPTQFMEKQAGKGDRVVSEQEMMQQLKESGTQEKVGALSKDPSKLKDVVGTTDPKANEDVAKGSGFVVGGKEGCQFKVGDQVRIEGSDMGTATTIQKVAMDKSSGSSAGHKSSDSGHKKVK